MTNHKIAALYNLIRHVDKMDPRECNLLKIMVKVLSTSGLFKFVGLSSRLITADPSIIFSFHHYPRLVGCQSNPRIGSFFKLTSQKEFQFHFSAFSVFNQGLVKRQCTANPFISTNCFPLSPSDLFHLLLIYLHYLYALSSIGLVFFTWIDTGFEYFHLTRCVY